MFTKHTRTPRVRVVHRTLGPHAQGRRPRIKVSRLRATAPEGETILVERYHARGETPVLRLKTGTDD